MKQTFTFLPVAASLLLTACASPTLQQLPKQEPGKGTVIAYSSTLNPTASLNLYVNNNPVGDIEGDKVKVVALTPGNYHLKVTTHNDQLVLNKSITVKPKQYYFYDVFTTTTRGRNQPTTYHFDEISQEHAMAYLQGPNKFTGWSDLVTNAINGKRIW